MKKRERGRSLKDGVTRKVFRYRKADRKKNTTIIIPSCFRTTKIKNEFATRRTRPVAIVQILVQQKKTTCSRSIVTTLTFFHTFLVIKIQAHYTVR